MIRKDAVDRYLNGWVILDKALKDHRGKLTAAVQSVCDELDELWLELTEEEEKEVSYQIKQLKEK